MTKAKRSGWLRWLQRLVGVLVLLAALAALVLWVEGRRARSAWEACERELSGRGESVRWGEQLVTAEENLEDNFLAAEVWRGAFGFGGDGGEGEVLLRRLDWTRELDLSGRWGEGKLADVAEWQEVLRGDTDRLKGIAEVTPSLKALREREAGTPLQDLQFLLGQEAELLGGIREAAAGRSLSVMAVNTAWSPMEWSENVTPYYAKLKGASRAFDVACWVHLLEGNPGEALRDVDVMLALARGAGSQPLLIGALVDYALVEIAMGPVWAGLVEHRWGNAELEGLEERLAALNMVEEGARCLRGERAFGLSWLLPLEGDQAVEDPMHAAIRWWPAAMRYRNQLGMAMMMQELLLDRLAVGGRSVRLLVSEEDQTLVRSYVKMSPYNLFVPNLWPAVEKSLEKTARVQVTVTLARVGVALERYWKAQGEYPEQLGALVPTYLAELPVDPVNGGALGYHRESGGHYLVYSVGLDGKDDAGKPAPERWSGTGDDAVLGDWVWRNVAGTD